ncbi:MAG: TlpA disulfide reductase family protein [Rhodospirillales bacterium]
MSDGFISRHFTQAIAACALVGVFSLISPALASDHEERCAAGGKAFKALEVSEEATPPPAVAFSTADGGETGLADFAGRGVIVNFWATWCAPCVREMPQLDALRAELESAGIDVIAVSMDRAGHKAVADFYERYKIRHLSQLVTPSKTGGTLGIRGLPTTLLVDPKGREVARIVGLFKFDAPESIEYFKRCLAPRDS